MKAIEINGKEIANRLLKQQQKVVQRLKNDGIIPKLVVITFSDDEASQVYIKQKAKKAKQIGIDFECHRLNHSVSQEDFKRCVKKYDNDPSTSGIIIQFPIPQQYDLKEVSTWISPDKDVDGLNPMSMGWLLTDQAHFLPCTPKGILYLMDAYNIDVVGKDIVIIGNSHIVGLPLAIILTHQDATVTLCHRLTANLSAKCQQADIIISAAGSVNLIGSNDVKSGVIIFDVGMNRLADGSLVGDVDYAKVINKAAKITPVPGGVGPMTVAMLMDQTIMATCYQHGIDYQQVIECR
ncbi:bifunctional 5,10-methylenetetrahydrofolate dehydrogenase/5,10-methenyltetrahydrofolate cyclohydrolase [Ignavigranum ruoffiae]|uniref:Bifunctional protein FolD n=1 Tax=Ignavigranum ruoffiae TaxID=89093 RepID=A0A1H9AP59_9LACT|nr:tetrahydrofolate dehydrogenase/cyclohydrolase catalytic domain-containing protein [Ignavigranum ruoffiae]SEP78449.1 methylenetetrahydrofolate dehydrogenase (NADP+) / methenyltetrahydrofolate cyclohydrolase [Ignavigranum ruoffiae]